MEQKETPSGQIRKTPKDVILTGQVCVKALNIFSSHWFFLLNGRKAQQAVWYMFFFCLYLYIDDVMSAYAYFLRYVNGVLLSKLPHLSCELEFEVYTEEMLNGFRVYIRLCKQGNHFTFLL